MCMCVQRGLTCQNGMYTLETLFHGGQQLENDKEGGEEREEWKINKMESGEKEGREGGVLLHVTIPPTLHHCTYYI